MNSADKMMNLADEMVVKIGRLEWLIGGFEDKTVEDVRLVVYEAAAACSLRVTKEGRTYRSVDGFWIIYAWDFAAPGNNGVWISFDTMAPGDSIEAVS